MITSTTKPSRIFSSFVTLAIAMTLGLSPSMAVAQTCFDVFASASRSDLSNPASLGLVPRTHEALRTPAEPVTAADLRSEHLQTTISKMIEIMDERSGIGIAAPQVGLSKRIIVAQIEVPEANSFQERRDLVVMVNPSVRPLGDEKTYGLEGCLSIGGQCGIVPRDRRVRVDYEDLQGDAQSLVFSGGSARVIQHEVDHLDGVLFTDRRASIPELLKIVRPRSLDERALITDAKAIWSKSPLAERLRWRLIIGRLAARLSDPYSLAWDLRAECAKQGTTVNAELRTLLRALASNASSERNLALDSWVSSETHALFLYDLLTQRGLKKYSDEISFLVANNLYFADGHLTRGPPTLLTYSFEKEGRGSEVSAMYRPPGVSDAEWFKKSDDERMNKLMGMSLPKKRFLPASTVAPTELKPSSLGGDSVELTNAAHPTVSWELSHKRYEISLHRLMQQIRETARLFRETHSFHVHTVFEVPRVDKNFASFRSWFKVLNDYLYLRGMEEGLHGNDLTSVVNLKEDVDLSAPLRSILDLDGPGGISKFGTKFFSAGLRGGG
ncbi:MAG: peptide deformylase, partial [Bdellovibrionota bacterium]